MNCAVVDITNKNKGKRDTQATAAKALSRYPQLFVANLANINNCKVQETTDVVFDDPGRDVSYGNGDSPTMKSAFRKGECTGKPTKNAGSKDASSDNSGGAGAGQWSAGQWSAPAPSSSKSNDCAASIASGNWHPECDGSGSRKTESKQQSTQPKFQQKQEDRQPQQSQQLQRPKQYSPKKSGKGKPNTKVQQELDAYLATLYGRDLIGRDLVLPVGHVEDHSHENRFLAKQHTENCKHEKASYPVNSHYPNDKDLDPYPEDGTDYSNKNLYRTQDWQYHNNPDSAYKRVPRSRRWTAYDKRAENPREKIKFYRGDESAYYKAQAQNQASAYTANDPSVGAPTQASTPTASEAPVESPAQKNWNDMTEAEKFEAYLRRMVELSSNLASIIKYAAASSVNIPYYPPAYTYDRAGASTAAGAQDDTEDPQLIRRSTVQPYPGPAVGSISAPGDGEDADDGFKAWFPNLVQGLMRKRQLVDPVTSEASAQAGDSISFFDALFASIMKAFGDPFHLYSDESEDNTPISSDDIPLVLGEPDLYSGEPNIPDFDIPDLDGQFTLPPETPEPETPIDDSAFDVPTIIISIDPIDDPTSSIYPGEDIPAFTPCAQPIPQIGFNSCLGGCNHTAEEVAAHDVYLESFAQEQAAYEACLQGQALDAVFSKPSHGILFNNDDDDDAPWQSEPEDASHRRPRPGQSLPLIPYPLPENFTGPYPANESDVAAPLPLLDETTPSTNDTAAPPLLPYQNKTLGELVGDILDDPVILEAPEGEIVSDDSAGLSLTPVPSDSSDDRPPIDQPNEPTNPLQEAADQAEEGVTIPQGPVVLDPSALETIADALPWFMGPGPVVTNGLPVDVDGSR